MGLSTPSCAVNDGRLRSAEVNATSKLSDSLCSWEEGPELGGVCEKLEALSVLSLLDGFSEAELLLGSAAARLESPRS